MYAVNKNESTEQHCSTAHDAGRKLRTFVDNATHEARDTIAATEKRVREHPLKSSAIAAGIGFFIGMLFRR